MNLLLLFKNAERKHSSSNTQLLVFLLGNSTVNNGTSHNLLVGEESLQNISRMLVVSYLMVSIKEAQNSNKPGL